MDCQNHFHHQKMRLVTCMIQNDPIAERVIEIYDLLSSKYMDESALDKVISTLKKVI